MAKAMVHLNGNALCAVDILTTGPTPGVHDIWQITVLPLDNFYKPIKGGLIPFSMTMKPHDPDSYDKKYISQLQLAKAMSGLDPFTGVDLFESWFKRLDLVEGKKIQVISHDWGAKASFLRHWLQPTNFDLHFHEWYRDLIPVSMYLNDNAEMNVEQIPYPKSKLSFICTRLGLPFTEGYDSLQNSVMIAQAYERIRKRLF